MRKLHCALPALLMAGACAAQTGYICRGGGSTIVSDRPCHNELQVQGITQQPVVPSRPPPPIGEAPAHITYMTPRCASLNDALRTAAARGLTATTVATMRRDYQRECGENEREASSAWSKAEGDRRQQQRDEKMAHQRAQEQARAQDERCGESRRILAVKKRRTDLNAGELAELQRFEENVRARCG